MVDGQETRYAHGERGVRGSAGDSGPGLSKRKKNPEENPKIEQTSVPTNSEPDVEKNKEEEIK